MDGYLELRCRWPRDRDEELATTVGDFPVLGVRADAAPDGYEDIRVYFEADLDDKAAGLGSMLEAMGALDIDIADLPSEDWMAAYRRQARPFAVGRSWWIDPRPESLTPAPPGRCRLAVEPSTAFGSGSHESTQLILSSLESETIRGCRVLDVGTGSAILAAAAAALGAGLVVGFDIDPHAVWVARQTVIRNDSGRRPIVFAGPIGAVGDAGFDVVLCNMISSRFIPLLGEIGRVLSPGGRVLFSGLVANEYSEVSAALGAQGFEPYGEARLGEWVSVSVVSRGR
jgi:ribosomal protein L11 methyltransferase